MATALSSYGLGNIVYIEENGSPVPQPPSVPASITFGQLKAGKSLQIMCTVSTDPEGDAINYIWERSIDGGIYSQIGITNQNTYADTVPTRGSTYNVRVKVRDSSGNESGYRVGTAQAINYNQPPTISGSDEARGTVAVPFTYTYAVTDTDAGDAIAVVEAVDGVEYKRFTATPGASYVVDIGGVWLTLGNGSHTLTITATDKEGESTVRKITFARYTSNIEVYRAERTTNLVRKCFLSIYPAITDEETGVLCEVSNNPFDPVPVWEEISGKLNALVHIFENTNCAGQCGIAYRVRLTPAAGGSVQMIGAAIRYSFGQAQPIDEASL